MSEAPRRSPILPLFAALTLTASVAGAQSWDTRRPVDLTSAQPSLRADEPVLIELGPGFDYGNAQPNGEDVRIVEDVDGVFCTPVWIETWNDAGSSRIWASVPGVPPGASSLQLLYGNATATPVSDFDAVFPDALVVSDGAELSGTISRGSVEIPAAATASLAAGDAVVIEARRVVIDGTVDGLGRGYAAGAPLMPGNGPGGGGTSTDAGSGGGGYGGVGGEGGFDAGDTPGPGGPVYGTDGFDLDLGSGGGSSDNSTGGAGGGALTIVAERVRGAGTFDLAGADADQPGGSRGGGGGSGGGLLIHGYDIDLAGATLRAPGGDGSTGQLAANDSGGGGGGGRLKLFYEGTLVPPAMVEIDGGLGGPNGSAAGGENGAPGSSVTDTAFPFPEVASAVGAPVSISLSGPCSGIFHDGFESGDTSRWSSAP